MVVRAIVFVALVAAALVYVQQNRVLQEAGLLGYCTKIATPARQSGHWHECHPGKLTGTPGMSLTSCVRAGKVGEVERWRCPTAVERNTARQ